MFAVVVAAVAAFFCHARLAFYAYAHDQHILTHMDAVRLSPLRLFGNARSLCLTLF